MKTAEKGPPIVGLSYKGLRVVSLIFRDFLDNQCPLHAAALSFTTILSLVPFFALAFAVLKGLGVHTSLEQFIIGRLAAGSPETVARIVTYIDNTKVGSMGTVGLVALVVTSISLLASVEEVFNHVWGVRETRPFKRRFSDYLSVVVSGPILLLAATSITTSLQSQELVQWLLGNRYLGNPLLTMFRLVPYLSIWIALVFLYVFIPNITVRFRSALLGGILAGTIWQVAQWGYIHFQVGVARYNAIYGTLSALPVFMVWIYTSWLIVLFGVEVVHAHQDRERFFSHDRHPSISFATRETVTILLLVTVGEAYLNDRPPWSRVRLAGELGVPEGTVRDLLGQLVDWGYLVAAEGDDPVYCPARALEHMDVGEVLQRLRDQGDPIELGGMAAQRVMVRDLLTDIRACAGTTVRDLVERMG